MGGTRPCAGEPRPPAAPDWAAGVSRVSQSLWLSRPVLHLFCIALPAGKQGRRPLKKTGWEGARLRPASALGAPLGLTGRLWLGKSTFCPWDSNWHSSYSKDILANPCRAQF